jgi:hypothetical protein
MEAALAELASQITEASEEPEAEDVDFVAQGKRL